MRKAAILCALVMMISVVPAFALTQTNNTTTDQVQNQAQTATQTCQATGDCGTCDGDQQRCRLNTNAGDCGTCDGDQNQYRHGQDNAKVGDCDGDQNKYQYGQKNRNNQK